MSQPSRGTMIGLMSGTSLDGVDAVALEIEDSKIQNGSTATLALPRRVLAHHSLSMPPELKSRLTQLCSPLPAGESAVIDQIELLGDARRELTDLYALAVSGLPSEITRSALAIGAHGQTIRHRPERSFSLQLIDGARLAEKTSLPVVTDLRAADIAAGGQGAPLAPVFHQAMLNAHDQWRVVLNLGGIANVTVLNKDRTSIEAGFDTGPANRLLDEWCNLHLGEAYDDHGRWAASGTVIMELLNSFIQHEFFTRLAPKSTGREDFSLPWLNQVLTQFGQAHPMPSPVDVQATLLELTVQSVANALVPYGTHQILVCGGGAANVKLMSRLQEVCGSDCTSTHAIGIDPQHVEGAAFAWLAWQHTTNRPINPGSGANGPRIAGALYPAPIKA